MDDKLKEIEEQFNQYAEAINKLVYFDSVILNLSLGVFDEAIGITEKVNWDKSNIVTQKLRNCRKNLQNIHENKSLHLHYQTIYNQAVVVWVSVLAVTLESLFKYCIEHVKIELLTDKKKDAKIHIIELLSVEDIQKALPSLILEADHSISFQDMQSIRRTFEEYFTIEIGDSVDVQNVAFTQAARHVIVHNAGRVNERFKNQIKSLTKRTLMKKFSSSNIQFDLKDAKVISENIKKFVKDIIVKVRNKKAVKQEF